MTANRVRIAPIVTASPVNRGQDERQKEKEKQRNRREVRNAPRQRPWLQFLRHLQCHVKSRNQILVIPSQFPALRGLPLFRGRQRILRKIESAEIRFNQEMKIFG